MQLSPIHDIIEDAKQGKMFILVDDEDRENEGDLVIPAHAADKDAINFMARFGRGLICLALDKKRIEHLGLPHMTQDNNSRNKTAFTVSIEAREGITTGISAGDRATTISTAIDNRSTKYDIVSPGHIFPLEAREGGVLVRAGHTEASVDISILAGHNPSAVICEIMKDDGTMARLPDLIEFAKEHNLKIATIADLIAYRSQNEQLIEQVYADSDDDFNRVIYRDTINDIEHLALIRKGWKSGNSAKVRMHSANILRDFSNPQAISEARNKADVIVIINNHNNISEVVGATQSRSLRNYGIGAQILRDIGVREMTLLTTSQNTNDIVAIEGYELSVISTEKL